MNGYYCQPWTKILFIVFQIEATSIYAFSDIMKTSVVSPPAGFNITDCSQCQAKIVIKENKKIYLLTLYIYLEQTPNRCIALICTKSSKAFQVTFCNNNNKTFGKQKE